MISTVTQDHHIQHEVELYKAPYQKALSSRNYRYIEDEFPPGTTPDEMEGNMGDPNNSWRYATCPYCTPCDHCGRFICHSNTIVVAVDGACRSNGTSSARAAISVYFGPNNMHNFRGVLDYDFDPTSQKAELSAAIRAIEIVRSIRSEEPDLEDAKDVIIKTDSAYLVNSMTQYMSKWKQNGFKTSKGQLVKNKEIFEYLDFLTSDIEKKENINIFFWHVHRQYNQKADEMVNDALDASSIGRPKVYIVAPKINNYLWFVEMYDPLLILLQERATVSYVKSTENLASLVEDANTRFFLIDEGILTQSHQADVVKFVNTVRQKGSRIVIGGLFPTMAVWKHIDPFFSKVFNLPWRCGSYSKDDLVLSNTNSSFSAKNLLLGGWPKALFIKHVPKKHFVYKMENGTEAYAACTRLGQGFVGYVGDVNCDLLFIRTTIAMLGLPPVYDKHPSQLKTRATKVEQGYGDFFHDRNQVDF